MKQIMILILMLSGVCAAGAQVPEVPVIGQEMPDVVLNVEYVNAGITSLKDLRGKPVVIDFFSKGCTSCFASFPRLNKLYPELKDKMHFILIGMDMKDHVRQAYEKFIKKHNLNMPVAYDSVLYKQWKINAVPHSIWIDKDGIVKAVTYSTKDEQLRAFSGGEDFAFVDTSLERKRIPFDSEKPFLINGNGGPDSVFLQRSLLAEWKPGLRSYSPYPVIPGDALIGVNSVQVVGAPLAELYRLAFFGRSLPWSFADTSAYAHYHYAPILELGNPSRFTYDRARAKNLFCYSLYRPEGGQPLHTIMQRDLQNFFGYEATVEVRKFPYLALVAKPGTAAKLTVNPSRKPGTFNAIEGGEFYNVPLSYLLTTLAHSNGLVAKDLPLVDETGITGNIDLSFRAAMTDFEDVKREFREKGFDVVQKEREMKVIVIRDGGR